MKNNNVLIVVLIVLLSVVAMSLIGIMGFLIINRDNNVFHISNRQSELIIQEAYEISEIQTIDFDLISLDINVMVSDDDLIHVFVYDNESDRINLDLSNKKLRLEEEERNGIYFFNFSTGTKVDLYLPKSFINTIDIRTISGDINIDGIYDNNFILNSISGDVKIDTIKELDVQTVSGDVVINKCDLKNIKTTSGDVKTNEIKVKENANISTVSGDVVIYSIKNVYIETNTLSGDVLINNNDRKSDNVLKINTTSGNIKVN